MASHNQLGNKGEQIARNYLTKKGYIIKEQNWRYKHKEIDIIALKDEQLIIVEIKTRSSDDWQHPSESITNAKIKFLVDATEAYIMEHDLDMETRFDVVSVIKNKNEWQIEHEEEAFYPPIS